MREETTRTRMKLHITMEETTKECGGNYWGHWSNQAWIRKALAQYKMVSAVVETKLVRGSNYSGNYFSLENLH